MIATHGTALTYEALQDMDVLHRSITEALRLNPPLILLLRYARTPFSVTTSGGKEFNIPKVWMLGMLIRSVFLLHICIGQNTLKPSATCILTMLRLVD